MCAKGAPDKSFSPLALMVQLVKITLRCVTSEFQSITIHALDLIDVSVWKRPRAAQRSPPTLILFIHSRGLLSRMSNAHSLITLFVWARKAKTLGLTESEWVWEQLPTVFMTRASLWVIFNHLELIRAGESRTNNSYTTRIVQWQDQSWTHQTWGSAQQIHSLVDLILLSRLVWNVWKRN